MDSIQVSTSPARPVRESRSSRSGQGPEAENMMGHESDSPPPSAPRLGHSGRKGSKKVRTGCITCKIRKVKCDEAKPFCMRCTKTGRRCDGYLDAKTMAQRRRRTGTLSGSAPCDPQAPPTLFFEWASADEKRSFHFFQHVTAPCLSGDFDGVFWRVLVLQICQSEPAVKHAVLAVSSLHEGMMVPYMDAEDRHSFALSQYNKAIAYLLDQMQNVDSRPLVPLLTCVLFVCIELMQNKDKESLLHLEQGRQILSQLGRKASCTNPEVDIIKQHLVPMYTRLSLTSWLIGCDPVAIPPPLKMLTEVPMMFDSVTDVRYALYDLMDECLRFAKRTHEAKFEEISPDEIQTFEKEQDYLLRKLAKFNVAFSLYQSSRARDAPPGAVALIQIHVHTTYIWLSTALSSGETAFDDHISTFSSIIPLAASFMDAMANPAGREAKTAPTSAMPDPRRFSSTFTFEMHVIAPLYYVATKCRHPLIRRAALDLLRRNPARRENLWRANVMAAIADHTIRLEEKHLKLTRSTSPAGPLPVSIPPFIATFVPTTIWDNDMRDAPLQDLFRPEASAPPPRAYYDTSSIPTSRDNLDMSSLGGLGQLPIDPSLLYDTAEVASSSHSFSAAPSIASSYDDLTTATIYVGGTRTTTATSIATSMAAEIAASPIPGWGAYGHSSHQRAPEISLEPPTPMDREDSWMFGSRPASGVSSSSDESGIAAALASPGLGPRSPDAPFDVPERFRVRESIIGPDKEDGIWVMMFRKLGGMDASWDVQTEYVAVA